ncbi:hypothetical protein [Streptomyces nigra]|uniref:hypothetical protein n=1 Tax=Streptomyces nigra TaxID=1827580 RepID=UPI0030D1AED1
MIDASIAAVPDLLLPFGVLALLLSEKRDARYLVTASTDLGDVSGWWPDRELVETTPKDDRVGP